MNAAFTTTGLSSRPGSDPVFGQFGGLFRTTLRGLRMQWFLYRVQRRKRAPEPVGEMSAHLLRDIGAPEEMIARAAAGKSTYGRAGFPFGLAAIAAAIVLIGAPGPAWAAGEIATEGSAQPEARIQVGNAPLAAVFAGEYVNGAPVYRFPAVVVTGSRKDGLSGTPPPCRPTQVVAIEDPPTLTSAARRAR